MIISIQKLSADLERGDEMKNKTGTTSYGSVRGMSLTDLHPLF